MSNSVSEFFSKEGIKKFKSGVKAFADRQAVKVVIASMVLATAFAGGVKAATPQQGQVKPVTAYAITQKGDTLCSYQAYKTDSVSFARLQNLVNNATKSKTGREVLKKISDQQTTLTVENAGPGTVGFYSPSDNAICLNPVFDDGMLQSCLVHEGKHAVQNFSFDKEAEAYSNFLTNTVVTRVMEADAMATQTKFSYEMAQVGDSLAWKSLRQDHQGIADAFENGAKKYGQDNKRTMKETMLAWYKDKRYVGLYDRSMLEFHANVVTKAPDEMLKDCFGKGVNVDKILKAVCNLDGKAYAGKDGSILLTPETAYLSRDNYKLTQMINDFYKQRTGNSDVSAVFLYPLNADGTVSTKTFAQENQEKIVKEKQAAQQKVASAVLKTAHTR